MNTTTLPAALAVLCSLAMFPEVGCRSSPAAADDGEASAAPASSKGTAGIAFSFAFTYQVNF